MTRTIAIVAIVDRQRMPTFGCSLYGEAEVLDLPAALEPLVDYFRCIAGEHADWAEYRQAMVE